MKNEVIRKSFKKTLVQDSEETAEISIECENFIPPTELPSETPRFASLDEAAEAVAGIRRAVGQDPGTALGAITLFRPQARELLQS